MRLSEAIALGRVLLAPYRGYLLIPGARGCALGMACLGAGVHIEAKIDTDQENVDALVTEWPWLINDCPHICPSCGQGGNVGDSYFYAISHIFDNHVANLNPDLSLDQLIDWVRSVEPDETPSLPDAVAADVIGAEVVQKDAK